VGTVASALPVDVGAPSLSVDAAISILLILPLSDGAASIPPPDTLKDEV
jgi:hypothetical protein